MTDDNPGTPEATEDPTGVDDARLVETADELVAEDLLVEDVSIDGMCGVY